MDRMKKIPVREQAPDVRNKNFEEVCYGYDMDEALNEASRCLNCKKPLCREGCPVNIDSEALAALLLGEPRDHVLHVPSPPPSGSHIKQCWTMQRQSS